MEIALDSFAHPDRAWDDSKAGGTYYLLGVTIIYYLISHLFTCSPPLLNDKSSLAVLDLHNFKIL